MSAGLSSANGKVCLSPFPEIKFLHASGAFMRKWLIEVQKCGQELTLEDDKRGLDNTQKTMSFSYIKPLPGSIGPRQTKCITSYTLEQFDLEKAVTINSSTQTPDVPSGSIFVTKTRYCLMWAPGNATRLIMNCTIEWSGKSWLKGRFPMFVVVFVINVAN